MKNRKLAAAALVCLLLAGCTSISAKEKTILLTEPSPTPVESPTPGTKSYEIRKIYPVSFDKLDPNGMTTPLSEAVHGWADDDNLLCMNVKHAQDGDSIAIISEIARLSYQYGFWDPILSMENTRIEAFDASPDLSLLAVTSGNLLTIYETTSLNAVVTKTRETFPCAPLFTQDGRSLLLSSSGDVRQLEKLDLSTGNVEALATSKLYCPLSQNGSGMLWARYGDKEDLVGLTGPALVPEDAQLSGGHVGQARMLGSDGLAIYNSRLMLVKADGIAAVRESTTAFALTQDEMHIALAVQNTAGSVDILIGYWGGTKPINEKLVYKDLDLQVRRMCFSPDGRKLYVQGLRDKQVTAYVFEFV